MPLRKHLHPRDAGNWPPDHGPLTRRPIAQPESTGPFLTSAAPSELELALEDAYDRAQAWRSVSHRLAQALLIPSSKVDTAASSLTTIALLPDVSPNYRSWMRGRVLADLLGRKPPAPKRPYNSTPARRAPLLRIELTTVGPEDYGSASARENNSTA